MILPSAHDCLRGQPGRNTRKNAMDVKEMFDLVECQHLDFEHILEAERRNPRADLCAMLYLAERFPGTGDIISAAEHDVIFFGVERLDVEKLTPEDVLYLARCGVSYDLDNYCLRKGV